MIGLATTVAFVAGIAGGLPQIARMVRCGNSHSQSPLGWAIGAHGALATALVGIEQGVPPTVYGPSLAGAAVATAGLGVTLYYRRPLRPVRLRRTAEAASAR